MGKAASAPGQTLSEPLWTLLSATSGVTDEAARARLIATGIPSLVPCSLSGVALLEPAGSWKLWGQLDGEELDEPLAAELLLDLEVRFVEALERGHLLVTSTDLPGALERRGVVCFAVTPLLSPQERLGALLVGRSSAEPLADREKFTLSRLAEQLAVGLENLRLNLTLTRHSESLEELVESRTADLRRSEERHRTLLELTRAVSSHREREDLFRAISTALTRVAEFDRMTVMVLGPEPNEMQVYAHGSEAGRPQLQPGASFPLDGTAPGWVIQNQRPFVGSSLADLAPYPISQAVLKRDGIRSNCLLPLIVDGKSIGCLGLVSKTAGRFDGADMDLLEEMADAIAVALDDSLAYEEITRLKDRLADENVYLREEIESRYNFEEIVGESPEMGEVFKAVETVAGTDANVLLTGETGTGKELIARAIHNLSSRKGKPLVKVNCAALPGELVEAEFFGHERGAFTGAVARRIGRFELASDGTILLDEIGDLPLDLQAKLLRVLQDGEFERVGGSRTIEVDVRVIAATNRDLPSAIRGGKFREDLYYRLNVFPIQLPPLRERGADLRLLVRHLVDKAAARLGKTIEVVPRRTMAALEAYSWPGNVRELENLIERAVILSSGRELEIGTWLPSTQSAADEQDGQSLEEVTRRHILAVLRRTGWRVSGPHGAARILGMKPTTLESRMKRLGIRRPRG